MIALKGGKYLNQLLNSDRLISQPSPLLDKIYALKSIPKLTIEDTAPLGTPTQELLISKDKLAEIAQEFKDNEISILGNRAIIQITKRLNEEINKQEVDRKPEEDTKIEESEQAKQGEQSGKRGQ
jgi:hypothetical protein